MLASIFSVLEERDDEWPEFGKMLDTEVVEILERAVMVKLPRVRRPIRVPLRSLTIQQVSNTSVLNLKVFILHQLINEYMFLFV